MDRTNLATRVGGGWLAVASGLMIAVLLIHGPIAPDLSVQMARVAESPLRWAVAHWLAAGGLSLYAISGLIVLTGRTRLTAGPWTLTAWAVLAVGALWTLTTAIAEATVVAEAARSQDVVMFNAWWAFAEGKATGFAIVALAVAVIAGAEARRVDGATPPSAAWLGAIAGIASFAGWALGMWLGVGVGSLIWVASSILMSLWTLWFGVVLARSTSAVEADTRPAAVSRT